MHAKKCPGQVVCLEPNLNLFWRVGWDLGKLLWNALVKGGCVAAFRERVSAKERVAKIAVPDTVKLAVNAAIYLSPSNPDPPALAIPSRAAAFISSIERARFPLPKDPARASAPSTGSRISLLPSTIWFTRWPGRSPRIRIASSEIVV